MNASEEWRLDTSRIGRRVLAFKELDSTNSHALTLARNTANDGLVVLADKQTAGRGQHGREWDCPGGAGVLMSVLIFPPPHLSRPAILTAWAAVSVCELILKLTGLQSEIKWPNDVLIQSRKVCGILIEQSVGTVVGIGLNLNQPDEYFAAAELPNAGSLTSFTGQQYDSREVARRLIVELDVQYEQLIQGNDSPLQQNWLRRLGLLEQQVEIETATAKHRGRLQHLSFDGLQLVTSDGTQHQLTPESVRHMRVVSAIG